MLCWWSCELKYSTYSLYNTNIFYHQEIICATFRVRSTSHKDSDHTPASVLPLLMHPLTHLLSLLILPSQRLEVCFLQQLVLHGLQFLLQIAYPVLQCNYNFHFENHSNIQSSIHLVFFQGHVWVGDKRLRGTPSLLVLPSVHFPALQSAACTVTVVLISPLPSCPRQLHDPFAPLRNLPCTSEPKM